MTHSTEAELRLLLDGRLTTERAETVAAHLDACEDCRGVVERMTEVSGSLWGALVVTADRDPASSSTEEGPTIAGYEDFRLLGRGGCGVVYLATESASGRLVAVKFLRGGATASPQERAWFLDEARAAANLRHPNIVTVLAVGEERGQPYYIMEHLPAGSLADRLDGAPLNPAEAAALVLEIARAIQHAHESGVIHRDLKPGNILLDAPTRLELPWTPKVGDFGMAKSTESGARTATPSQAIFGTPGYMAPEQAFGRSRDVRPAADVYALGAILYELLTGRPPFQGGTAYETLLLVRDGEPLPPGRIRPGLPRDLETVCLKCLEKEPGRRYASAARLADDLEAFRAGRPVAARPVGRLGRLERWARREPAVAGLSAATLLLVASLFVVVTIAWRRAVTQRIELAGMVKKAEDRSEKLLEALVFSGEAASKLFLNSGLLSQVDSGALIAGLKIFEQVPDLPGAPQEEHRLAYATLQIAGGLFILGESEHSGRAIRRALATLERLTRTNPERPEFAFHYAEGCMQLAGLAREAGRADEERHLHLEALRIAEDLVERHPTRGAYAHDLAVSRSRVAEDLMGQGRDDEAEPLLEQSTTGLRDLIARYPDDPNRYEHFRHASTLHGILKLHRRDLEAYESLIGERLAMCDLARSRKDWRLIFNNLIREQESVLLHRAGRLPTAERFVAFALAGWREIATREPGATDARHQIARWLAADGYQKWSSDPSAAGEAFRQAIAIWESLIEGPERSNSLVSLARLRAACDDPAIRDPSKAVAHARELMREHDRASFLLGSCLCENGEYEAAREELERFLAEPSFEIRGWPGKLARLYLALAYRKLGMQERAAAEIAAAGASSSIEGTIDWPTDAAFRRIETLLAERPENE